MALKQPLMVATFENESEVEVRAKVGESLLIKGIYATQESDYAVAYIDKTTVGFFRTGADRGGHLTYPDTQDNGSMNLLDFLRERKIFTGYPVAEGQSFVFKSADGTAFDRISILYEVYDAGDIHPNQENGSEADSYFFLNYGRPSNVPSNGGDVIVDTSIVPAEFPAFPFGDTVPAKTEIELYGFAGVPCGCSANSGANQSITTYVKMIKERVVLFDEGKNGLTDFGYVPSNDGVVYDSRTSLLGDLTDNNKRFPLMFPNPLVFNSGEELNVYRVVRVKAGQNCLTPQNLEITAILKVKRGG